ITCWGAGGLTCIGTSQPSVSLAGGTQTTVTATYTVGSAGTATLWLKAAGTARDSGSYAVVVGAPIVDLGPYNYASQNYGRCVQTCFAAVYAQGTVPSFSLDAPRSVVLAYNS